MPSSHVRLLRLLPVALLLFPLGLTAASTSPKQSIPIDSGWQFRQRVETGDAPANGQAPAPSAVKTTHWLPAQVPGDVHLDLLHNNLIPDPFYRDNEAKLQWVQDASWEYQTTLTVTQSMLAHQHVELVFDGLDSAADVSINGQHVLSADNMFRQWRVDVHAMLKPGANTLLVVFPSPIKAAQKVAANDPWQSRTKTAEKTYIRKAAYEYGWDWGPRFVTSGIWRPAHLDLWDDARIDNFYIQQQEISKQAAELNLKFTVQSSSDQKATLQVNYDEGGHQGSVSRDFELVPGENDVDLPLEIANPDLWYPTGYGAQPIYHFHARLTEGKATADEADAKAGMRKVVLRRDVDQWGRSFEFVVNGIPVFAKGADVIPFDSFPNRVTTAQYRQILQSAKDANMNMIRHWGGGYYETQEFYDICDELGLMVWQDFMFGNDWQPGTYSFKQNVEKEVEYQVKRLRNHPSIVLWSGNNETESAFAWGGRSELPADVRLRMWQDYLTTFSGVIARTVAQFNPETPYWPSSPSADYEDTSAKYMSGDMHDWSVWHGNAEFSEYEKHFPRFVSEYGFQSFPEMRTIEAFTKPEDRTSIFTPVMLAHQKNDAGNQIIHDYMLRYYGEPTDFASFLYASQVLQAESTRIGAEHWRRLRPRTMGSIFWQLNDCWPVASWASIDYYGRWKALQYYAKRFYAPVLVSPYIEDGKLDVYVVSDRTEAQSGQLRLRIMDFNGKVLKQQTLSVSIPALSSSAYIELPLSEFVNANGTDSAAIFGAADLTIAGQPASSNIIYFAPTKQVHLPQAKIASELSGGNGTYTLKLSSPVLARDAYVSFGDNDVKFSDNYVDLLPGEPQTITVTSSASLEMLRSSMKVVSLVDAFGAQPASAAAVVTAR